MVPENEEKNHLRSWRVHIGQVGGMEAIWILQTSCEKKYTETETDFFKNQIRAWKTLPKSLSDSHFFFLCITRCRTDILSFGRWCSDVTSPTYNRVHNNKYISSKCIYIYIYIYMLIYSWSGRSVKVRKGKTMRTDGTISHLDAVMWGMRSYSGYPRKEHVWIWIKRKEASVRKPNSVAVVIIATTWILLA